MDPKTKPSIVRREPIVTAGAIVTLVLALIKVTNGFGLTTITQDQQDALSAAIVALWPLLLVLRQMVWSPASVQALVAGLGEDVKE